MSQHDLHIANQLFPAFRTALNNAFAALGSTMIGSSAPSSPLVGMLWIDNSAAVWRKKLYDGTDWITIAEIDPASNEHCPYVKSFKFEPDAMASALIPDADASRDLGSAAHRWGTLHAAALDGVGSVNAGPLAGFRNAVINGNFDIWQRGTSQSGTGYGSDDRWRNHHNGSTKTHSREAFALGQTDVPGNPSYFSRTVVSSVAGASHYVHKYQLIEDVRTFAGETMTLSFWAKADAPKNIAVDFVQWFGTGGTPSPGLRFGVQKFPVTSSWQKIATTVAVPGLAGKTLGTDGESSLLVVFWFDAGSDYADRTAGLGQQSGTFDLAQVQLEPGGVATPFERRPMAAELALCQRYFERGTGSQHIFSGRVVVNNQYYKGTSFAVTKRADPTVVAVPVSGVGFPLTITGISTHLEGFFEYRTASSTHDGAYFQSTWTADAEL